MIHSEIFHEVNLSPRVSLSKEEPVTKGEEST